MAWTEAARAAAEARRVHKKARTDLRYQYTGHTAAEFVFKTTGTPHRQRLAKALRALRSGRSPYTETKLGAATIRSAVISTQVRNEAFGGARGYTNSVARIQGLPPKFPRSAGPRHGKSPGQLGVEAVRFYGK